MTGPEAGKAERAETAVASYSSVQPAMTGPEAGKAGRAETGEAAEGAVPGNTDSLSPFFRQTVLCRGDACSCPP